MTMKKLVFLSLLLITLSANAQQPKSEWVTIKSPNLKCWECKERVDKYLEMEKGNTEAGILQWKINLLQGEIKVQFLPDRASADGIRTALNNAGFDADNSKATEDAYKKLPPACKRSEDGGGPQPRKPCHVKPFY
jgi:periplasmic mercuric ion binding protein